MESNLSEPLPDDEEKRLENLRSYKILDTEIEQALDHLTQLAASLSESPVALISLIDRDRQWFKSKFGWNTSESHRSFSFCHYTIKGTQVMEVPDALLDSRFSQNPFVTGTPNIRHYAGAPLISPEGFRLGSLCVIDKEPKQLTEAQKLSLALLSQQVVAFFELKKKEYLLELQKRILEETIVSKDSELNVLNYELNTFIYKASHTLRGPLATIRGISQYGENQKFSNDAILLFKMISETGIILDGTVSKLFEAVEIKNKPLEREAITFSEIKNEIISNNQYADEDISISTNLPGYTIHTDKYLFLSIIRNLVDNSVSYKSKFRKLKVNILIEWAGEYVFITIQDNSEGIPEDVQESLFNLHYKGHHKSKGAGMGLFLVHKAVLRLNGEIKFESKLDKGSIFVIRLPVKVESE